MEEDKGWDPFLLFPRGVWTAITLQSFPNKPDHKPACEVHIPVRAGTDAVTELRPLRRATRLYPSEHDKHDDDEQHEPETAAAIVTGTIEWTAAEATEASEQRYDKKNDKYGS